MKVMIVVAGIQPIRLPDVLMGKPPASMTELKDGKLHTLIMGVELGGGYLAMAKNADNFELPDGMRLTATNVTDITIIKQNIGPGEHFEYKFIHRSGKPAMLRLEM